MSCSSGGNSKSTSQKYPVSASSEVFKICSKVMPCNVAGRVSSDTVRNVSDRLVSELLSDVGGELVRNVSGQVVRNVAGEVFSGMVPNVGRGDSRVRNFSVSASKPSKVGGFTSSNFKSLYGRG